jgi:hypothetical protein
MIHHGGESWEQQLRNDNNQTTNDDNDNDEPELIREPDRRDQRRIHSLTSGPLGLDTSDSHVSVAPAVISFKVGIANGELCVGPRVHIRARPTSAPAKRQHQKTLAVDHAHTVIPTSKGSTTTGHVVATVVRASPTLATLVTDRDSHHHAIGHHQKPGDYMSITREATSWGGTTKASVHDESSLLAAEMKTALTAALASDLGNSSHHHVSSS